MADETGEALESAAEAVEDKAVAVADAAGAIAENEKAKAAEATVAAATAAAALAETESAKAKQAAAEEITETKGDISWLKGNLEVMANSQNETRALSEATAAQVSKLTQVTGQILSLLSTPKPSSETPQVSQANPQNVGEEDPKKKPDSTDSKPKTAPKKGKLWT